MSGRMEVVVERRPRVPLEDFAVQHGLRMVVSERGKGTHESRRFYASFYGVEVKEGGMLRSEYGDGPTPEHAIAAYAREISEELLIVDAMSATRREIPAPILTYAPTPDKRTSTPTEDRE